MKYDNENLIRAREIFDNLDNVRRKLEEYLALPHDLRWFARQYDKQNVTWELIRDSGHHRTGYEKIRGMNGCCPCRRCRKRSGYKLWNPK